jgi:hypothetical protein
MPERILANSRTLLLLGTAHVVIGAALLLFIKWYLRNFLFSPPRNWYESYWLPLIVACLVYVVEAPWTQVPMGWLYGLLITAPPYGWHAAVLTLIYVEDRASVTASEYLKIALPPFLLALSGTFLSPAIRTLARTIGANFKAHS